jgi:hypothetical protein
MLSELITEEFTEFSTFNHFVDASVMLNRSEVLHQEQFRQGFLLVLESIPRAMQQAAVSTEIDGYNESANEIGKQLVKLIERFLSTNMSKDKAVLIPEFQQRMAIITYFTGANESLMARLPSLRLWSPVSFFNDLCGIVQAADDPIQY